MAAYLSPIFNEQTFISGGSVPASGYKLFTYAAGSSTKQTTYTDSAGTIPQSNPIILNAAGRPTLGPIWQPAGLLCKYVLAGPNDTDPPTSPVTTIDDVPGVNDPSSAASNQWQPSGVTPTYINASTFTLLGDQTTNFHAGRRLQFTTTVGTVYGTIKSSLFGALLTTVTMNMDGTTVLDSGLTDVNVAIIRFDHTPIGMKRTTIAEAVSTTLNLWHEAQWINLKAELGADNTGAVDCSTLFTAAIATGRAVFVPAGTYTANAVQIANSTRIIGEGAATIIKRPDNSDQDNVGYGTADISMFDVTVHNIEVLFESICIDGNEANQNVATPSGAMIRAHQIAGSDTSTLRISARNCLFINPTFTVFLVSGNDSTTGEELLTVSDCTFLDGRKGIGNGDPASSSANGFTPFYINAFDRFRVQVNNNRFLFRKTLTSTEYAPGAIRWTWEVNTTNADGASGAVTNNFFYRLGRKDQKYNGTLTGNNGLGVLDFYSRGREIIISGNVFNSCFQAGVRGKSNADKIVISNNIMSDMALPGIEISPDTYDTQTGFISITGNVIRNCDQYGIGVVGNTTSVPSVVNSVVIANNVIENVTNSVSELANCGGILVRYADNAIVSNNVVKNTPLHGIIFRDCAKASAHGNTVHTVSGVGVYFNGITEKATAIGNMVKSSGSWGIAADGASTADMLFSDNQTDTTVDYGIIAFNGTRATYTGNIVVGVSGLSRGMFLPTTLTWAEVTGNYTNATTGLFYPIAGNIQQSGNSWNPTISYRPLAPIANTWRLGDIVYHTAPVSGGNIGWVCTVAGTPGTWAAFGTIT